MDWNSEDATDQFIEDFGRYVVGSFAPALIGVATLSILTRAFVPRIYGQYALAMVFVTVTATVAAGWIGQSTLRLEPELDDQVLLSNAVVALLGVAATVVFLGAVGYVLAPFGDRSYRLLFLAGVILVVAQAAYTVTRSILQARLDSKRATVLQVVRAAGRLVLGIPLAIVVVGHPAGWLLGSAIATVLSILYVWRSGLERPRLSVDRSTVRRMVSFGVPMIGWLLGFTLLTFVDRVFLEFLVGTRAVGLYTSNYSLANKALPLVLAPVIQASHPIIMNTWDGDNIAEVESRISEMSRYLLITGAPATALIALSSAPLSGLLLDQDYQKGHLVIPIIALSVFIWHLAMLAHKGLEVKERTRTMLFGVAMATVVNVGLNLVTIPRYGYIGAAAATLVSFTCYLAFAIAMAERHIPWRPPVGTLGNVAVATAVMSGCVYLVYRVVDVPVLALATAALVAGIVYLTALFATGEFTEQELLTVRELVSEAL